MFVRNGLHTSRLARFAFTQVRWSHYNLAADAKPKTTIPRLQKLYKKGTPISMVTAHDCISATIADRAGVDITLVGDSLAMVSLGYEDTNAIELDDMIHHCRAVARGTKSAFLIADLPFGSYGNTIDETYRSAVQMVKRGMAEGIKMEGGKELAPHIKKLTEMGIPVCGHIGLTPQRQASFGGFKVQGKTADAAMSILDDALAVQEAGAFIVVLEAVPDRIGQLITSKLKIPTIGIGAGPHTSGQVLVQLDMLGGFDAFTPKFLKKYSNLLEESTRAVKEYSLEVKSGAFPAPEHCYTIADEEFEKFKSQISSA